MADCTHPMVLGSLCAVCGKIVEEGSESKAFSSLTMAGGVVLKVSTNEALSIQQNKVALLQESRRLALVLDIDNTLVHATYAKGGAPPSSVQQEKDIYHLPIEEVGVDGARRHLVIKKRPHLDHFLVEMQKSYQMTIYTAGTKRYAEAVTRVIDPTGEFIGGRIVARGEDGVSGAFDKSLQKIFLNDSSMAVILDDREDVWRGPQSEQLLVVRPYEFFYPGNAGSVAVRACSEMGYVNNAPGTATAQAPPPDAHNAQLVPVIALHQPKPGVTLRMATRTSPQYTEADDQLLRCLDLLSGLHRTYYDRIDAMARAPSSSAAVQKPTVAELLRHHRSLVLRGCVVAIAADPWAPHEARQIFMQRMRSLARALGASVVFDLHPKTTHVIAVTEDCPLAREALANRSGDVWLLHVDWLHHCRWALAKAEESTFMLRPPPPGAPFPRPNYSSPPLSAGLMPAVPADATKKRGRSSPDSTTSDSLSTQGAPPPSADSAGAPLPSTNSAQPASKRRKTVVVLDVALEPEERDEDAAILAEVERSAHRLASQQRQRNHRKAAVRRGSRTTDDDEEAVDYERDSGMKCCMGPGDEDDNESGAADDAQSDSEQPTDDDADRPDLARYASSKGGRDSDAEDEGVGSDDYDVRYGGGEDEDEDDEEEEMALIQMLRSRATQQQLQAPIPDALGPPGSDSDSEGFAALGAAQWGWSHGRRSANNSSAALNGMDSYPNSAPASPLSPDKKTLEGTERVLDGIAPGPGSDMDEEEEQGARR